MDIGFLLDGSGMRRGDVSAVHFCKQLCLRRHVLLRGGDSEAAGYRTENEQKTNPHVHRRTPRVLAKVKPLIRPNRQRAFCSDWDTEFGNKTLGTTRNSIYRLYGLTSREWTGSSTHLRVLSCSLDCRHDDV